MFRRRPLMRAAVVGGVAYHAGKRGAQNAAQEQSQDQQIADLQAQQAAPAAAPAPAAGGMSADSMAKLEQLAKLHEEGILTDAEFEVQKQKILQGM